MMYPLDVPDELARRRSLVQRELHNPLRLIAFLLPVLLQYLILEVLVDYHRHFQFLPFLFDD